MKEIYRVLKNNGILAILEFSIPSNFLIKKIYTLYSKIIIYIGEFLSRNYFAYSYLNKSIKHFSFFDKKIKKFLKYHNFELFFVKKLTFEIVSIYLCKKINQPFLYHDKLLL